jgi:hypothetical protein
MSSTVSHANGDTSALTAAGSSSSSSGGSSASRCGIILAIGSVGALRAGDSVTVCNYWYY